MYWLLVTTPFINRTNSNSWLDMFGLKLDPMRFLQLLVSVSVTKTCFSVQNDYSLAHLRRAVYMERALERTY